MDAITLLKDDHKTVKRLFREFEKADDPGQQTELARQIVEELSVHAYLEEEIFYPAAREAAPDTEEHVLESYEEHHIVKWVCSELFAMTGNEERFEPKVTVLSELVKHHVEEEENDWFPEVRKEMGRKRLVELGEQMLAAKQTAPREPQPEPAVRG